MFYIWWLVVGPTLQLIMDVRKQNTLFRPLWPPMFPWNDKIVLKTNGSQGPYVWET